VYCVAGSLRSHVASHSSITRLAHLVDFGRRSPGVCFGFGLEEEADARSCVGRLGIPFGVGLIERHGPLVGFQGVCNWCDAVQVMEVEVLDLAEI